jgi:hypothetical protein
MKHKKSVIYEVLYTENGQHCQYLGFGKNEAKELHKSHPGSTFNICKVY